MINRPQLVKNQSTFNSGTENPYTDDITIGTPDKNSKKVSFQLKNVKKSAISNSDVDAVRHPIKAANSPLDLKLNSASQTGPIKTNKENTKEGKYSRHILILNNRIMKQNNKINALQKSLNHLSIRSIGYKELGLTLFLSILVFTSLGLVLTSHSFTYKSQPIDTLNQSFIELNKKLNLLNLPADKSATNDTGKASPSFKTNQYNWPLERSPKSNQLSYNNFKNGINIAAKLGDPIVAIDSGVVIFSERNFSDYGNLILLQHSDDVISVYGNNYSNYVKKGQVVKKGELLAAVGETQGNLPRLYFEIRHKGKAQDPFLYY